MGEKNVMLLAERQAEWDKDTRLRLGDFVRFACGALHRISNIRLKGAVQTSNVDRGAFYLGHGYTEFSGTLRGPISIDSLTNTTEIMGGEVWFFDNGIVRAGGRINAVATCRVYECRHAEGMVA